MRVLGLSGSAAGFAAFAALQLWLVFTHAPWDDEWQALLIARQPWSELFHSLHYEGHPALWYLILHGLAGVAPIKAVLPIAQAPIAIGILAMIWFRSPFPVWMKALICIGYYFSFEYTVISRSYGLGVLLFFAFVSLRRSSWAWLLLALMVDVSFHSALLAGVCVLWLIVDGRWSWRGAGLIAIAGVLFLLTAWPAPDVVPAVPPTPVPLANVVLSARAALALWAPVNPLIYPVEWQWLPENAWLAAPIGLLLSIVGAMALRRNRLHVVLFGGLAFVLYVLPLALYYNWPRHWGHLVVLFVGLLWAQVEAGERPTEIAVIWLGALAVGGVAMMATALTQPFSPARQAAAWITEHKLQGEPWAAISPFNGVAVSGELGRPFYNPLKRCSQTFNRWNYRNYPQYTSDSLARVINNYANTVGGGYLIMAQPNYRMLRETPLVTISSPTMNLHLRIYFVRPLDPKPRPVQPCA